MSGSDEEKCFCVELVERSENAADLSWVFNLPEMEEASYGEGDLYQDVGEVIVDQLAGRRLSGVAIQATR